MKILFTICGRAGSKGIKNKNIIKFCDYPLPFYTLSAIDLFLKTRSDIESDIVLNTDSLELEELISNNINRKIDVKKRSKELGEDDTPKIDVIKNSYDYMLELYDYDYDMIIDLDITSPLRTILDLENLVLKKNSSDCDVVFSVTESRRNPYFNMVKKHGEYFERVIGTSFNSRQEAPEVYDMNASLYAYSPEFLKSDSSIFDGKCDIIQMKDTGVLDLDNQNDFELMEIIADYLFSKYKEYKEVRDNINNLLIK